MSEEVTKLPKADSTIIKVSDGFEPVAKTVSDSNVVDFSGDDDRWDPKNRPEAIRWMHVAFVAYMAFVMFVSLSVAISWLI
jgi:predicted RNA-binding protein with PUA-like domain